MNKRISCVTGQMQQAIIHTFTLHASSRFLDPVLGHMWWNIWKYAQEPNHVSPEHAEMHFSWLGFV